MDLATLAQVLDSTLRLATPLLFACLAGLISERAGIFDIGLEGKILASAFLAAAIAFVSGNVWLGVLAGIAVSVCMSLIHGVASITFRGNQLISGVAINFLAAGLTVVIAQNWFQQGGRTPSLTGDARMAQVDLPFANALADVPLLGPIYGISVGPCAVGLLGVSVRARDVVFAVPHPVRLAPARGGRKPGGGGHGGRVGHWPALWRSGHLRRALRVGGGVSVHGPVRWFCQGYERGARLYRAGGDDLCQMAALARDGRGVAFWPVGSRGKPFPVHRDI